MKTRDQIYHREGEKLLRFLTTYHALKYEQVMKMFGNQDSIKSLITSLVKQGRIYHDKEAGLLCDSPEAAKSPDRGTIAAFWVLLDFEKPIVFHTSGDFPVKLHFFSENEEYAGTGNIGGSCDEIHSPPRCVASCGAGKYPAGCQTLD